MPEHQVHPWFASTTGITLTSHNGSSTKKKSSKKKDRSLTAAQRNRLHDKDFAFPKERKEPIIDARHVRNAAASVLLDDDGHVKVMISTANFQLPTPNSQRRSVDRL